jgi:hypothetical protein
MKLKDGFVLRQVGGQTVVLPSGGDLNLNMMITLNATGKYLWEQLQEEISDRELKERLQKTYEIDEATAAKAVDAFVADLNAHGFLQNQ